MLLQFPLCSVMMLFFRLIVWPVTVWPHVYLASLYHPLLPAGCCIHSLLQCFLFHLHIQDKTKVDLAKQTSAKRAIVEYNRKTTKFGRKQAKVSFIEIKLYLQYLCVTRTVTVILFLSMQYYPNFHIDGGNK